MLKLLVVDDHAIVRLGLRQILESEDPGWHVEEAENGREALRKIRDAYWDVVVLDISMPGRNGLEVLKQLRRERSRLPVLILSMHAEEHYAVRVIRAGASGYLTKETAMDNLVAAVRALASGKRFITPSVAERLAVELGGNYDLVRHQSLSDREYQVFRLIASGKTVTDIGHELSLSVKTISTHRARIMKKMNFRNNAELTHYAIKNALVE